MSKATWNQLVMTDLQTCEAILGRRLTAPEILQRVEALLKFRDFQMKYTPPPPQDE
jgi:hypothetical protein